MKALARSDSLTFGFALFAMFFGAGNLIFPLALGYMVGDKNYVAMAGLLITAVAVPFLGVIAITKFEGNYRRFFDQLGRFPGFVLAALIIALIGPLGCTPRCIALCFSTVKTFFPDTSSVIFSLAASLLIYALALCKTRVMDILGKVLTPLLLVGLGYIVVCGFIFPGKAAASPLAKSKVFVLGLKEGYNTMDLLAAFFFSSTIIAGLKLRSPEHHKKKTFKALAIGALLLTAVYLGFSTIASLHAEEIGAVSKEKLLTALALHVSGKGAGLILSVTVAITCLTTAIALVNVFCDFIHKEVLKKRVPYRAVLAASLALTFFMACKEFTGISSFLAPILEYLYPGLIALTTSVVFFTTIRKSPFPWSAVIAVIVTLLSRW